MSFDALSQGQKKGGNLFRYCRPRRPEPEPPYQGTIIGPREETKSRNPSFWNVAPRSNVAEIRYAPADDPPGAPNTP